jgi:hypothetical protein
MIEWKVFNHYLQFGHCFGISLASQEFRAGKLPYRNFNGGPGAPRQAFDLPGAAGPNGALSSRIDVDHVKQFSAQFIDAWVNRKRGVLDQLQTLETELVHNRSPIVSILKNGEVKAHALLAYDMAQTATTADIYVYDSNRPFEPGREEAELTGPLRHKFAVNEGVVHVNKEKRTWSFSFVDETEPWSGGNAGSLWVLPSGAVPDDPTLPSLDTARTFTQSLIFGSSPGAVRTQSRSAGAEELAAEAAAPGPGPAGSVGGVWAAKPGRPLDVSFEGRRPGHYTQVYNGSGFVAAVGNVETAKGVRDRVIGDGDGMTFAGGKDRPLQLKLARRTGPALTSAATVRTSASAGGQDSVGLTDDGALVYGHDGHSTMVSFTLSEIRKDGGPQTFISPRIEVRGGERLQAAAMGRGLNRVLVSIRRPDGSHLTRVLRNRAIAHRHLRIGAPRVSGHRVAVRLHLSGFHRRAIVGVVLRLRRGGHVVARRAVSLHAVGENPKVVWRLPGRLARGRYQLRSYARAIVGGGRDFTASGSASAHRAATVRLK